MAVVARGGASARLEPFEWSEQYRVLHSRAHRKTPARIGSPALTRHLTLWIPKSTEREGFQERRERWVRNLDWFLANFILRAYEKWEQEADDAERIAQAYIPTSFNAWRTKSERFRQNSRRPIQPAYLYEFCFFQHAASYDTGDRNRLVQFMPIPVTPASARPRKHKLDVRYETVSFRVYYGRIPIKVRAELYTEYFTLSFAAQLDIYEDNRVAERRGPICDSIKSHFDVLCKTLEDRWKAADDRPTRRQSTDALNEDLKKLNTTPAYLFRTFWDGFDAEYLTPGVEAAISAPNESSPLRHTRRAVRLDDGMIGARVLDFRGAVLSYAPGVNGNAGVFDRAFTAPRRNPKAPPKPICDAELYPVLLSTTPLIEGAWRALASEREPEKKEQPVRHEYAVSKVTGGRALFVSALGPQPVWQDCKDPGSYLIVTNHRDRWQIGRLVDRLHTICTLRVASLWDFERLNAAGFQLRKIGEAIDEATHQPERADIDRLNDDFRIASQDVGDGGLSYRADRAVSYIDQFVAECKDLRIKRVDSYQSYTVFVRRRIGGNWEYIRRLSAQYNRLRHDLDLLNNELNARAALQQTRKLAELLSVGELVAAVPVAYYGRYLLEKLAENLAWCRAIYEGYAKVLVAFAGADPAILNVDHAAVVSWPFFVLAALLYFAILWFVLKPVLKLRAAIGRMLHRAWRRRARLRLRPAI